MIIGDHVIVCFHRMLDNQVYAAGVSVARDETAFCVLGTCVLCVLHVCVLVNTCVPVVRVWCTHMLMQ